MTGSTLPPRQTVHTAQVMRGFAAAAVAVYHTHLILLQPEYGAHDIFGAVASRGWAGVNFFFVLSGFIILFAHAGDIGRPARAGRYLWRRFVRVYPIYWIFTAAYVAAGLAGIGYPDFRWDARNLIASLTLVMVDPDPAPPLKVAWTLFYEVMFYAAFLGLILHRGFGIALFAVWLAAILIASLVLGRTGMGPLHMWNVYFMIGMGSYFLFRTLPRGYGWPLLAGGIASLIALLALGGVPPRIATAQDSPADLLALAVVFALMLTGATLLERGRTWRAPAILVLLGDASYAVYLVHSPALSLIAAINHRFLPGLLPPWLLFVGAASAALIAGVLAHLLVEKPLLARLRRRPGSPAQT